MVIEVRQTTQYVRNTDSQTDAAEPDRVLGPFFVGDGSELQWVDEDATVWSDQERVVGFSSKKTLGFSDRKTLQVFSGSTATEIKIPDNTTTDFSIGTKIRIVRNKGAATLLLDASAVTLIAPDNFAATPLYPGEIIEIQKVGGNEWVGRVVNPKNIEIIAYNFLTRPEWKATGLNNATHVLITPSVGIGKIAVDLTTEESGGVFALKGAIGSRTATKEVHGFYSNAVHLRRPITDVTVPAHHLHVMDGGVRRLVFGLLHTSADDGDDITPSNLYINFVYETTGGVLANTTISGDIEFELLFAVSQDNIPYRN